MIYQGNLIKMETINGNPIKYYLNIGEHRILMNDLIGKQIRIKFLGEINCIHCGNRTKKSYHQGYCYPCFSTLPQTDISVVQPEKDQSHLGISRDMEWAKNNSLTDHYVYLALTSNLKVGVTRAVQTPTRWIDQGAIKAIRLAKTPYRALAGDIEVFFKNQNVADRTQWKQMLMAKESDIDLLAEKEKLSALLPEDLKQYVTIDNRVEELNYPGDIDLSKIYQRHFDEEDNHEIKGHLMGIKGQYLVFKQGFATSIRRHNGYKVELEVL